MRRPSSEFTVHGMRGDLQLVRARPATRRRTVARFAVGEVAIWALVYGTYLAVRSFSIGKPHEAVVHAADVVRIERDAGVFHERSLQHELAPIAHVFSTYYLLGFAPLITVMTFWLGLRQRELYRRFRNALLVSVSLASIGYVCFPTAPPRLAHLGIADTVGMSAHDTGSVLGIRFNPYAAVPSMHVGWSVIVAYIGWRAVRRPWLRAVFVAHPVLMALAVTATGNHFFFDCAAGALVAAGTLLVLERRRPRVPQLRVLAGAGRAADAADQRKAA
jgi:hypothetical protein